MDNMDKIKRELYSMSKKEKQALISQLENRLTDKQQDALKSMLSSRQGKSELEKAINGLDLSGVKSKDDLTGMLDSAELKKKLRDLLG